MLFRSAAGGAIGSVVPGVGTAIGGIVGTGAGAFALPTAIRESLMQAYSKGSVTSASDFLGRANIVLQETGKDALIGGVSSLTGMGAARLVGKAVAPSVGQTITAGTAAKVIGAAEMGGTISGLVVTPSLLEGKLPEPQDFTNAAILMVGLKGAHVAAGKLRDIYAKTGIPPEQVLADSKSDPTIAVQMADPKVEVPEAYKKPVAEHNAVNAVSGEKALEVKASPFAEVKQAAGEPARPTEVNYNYINSPEDVKGAMARLSQVYENDIQQQRRGTVTWEQTQQEAGKIIEIGRAHV